MSPREISIGSPFKNIKLTKSSIASLAFRQIADSTIYGTPGKMRYAHTKSSEKIKSIKDTSFLEFKRNEVTLGIVALVGHQLNISDQTISGLYVRYFSFNAPMQSQGQRTKTLGKKSGLLHQIIKGLFNEPSQLSINTISDRSIIYAFVESTNERSLSMVKSMGFKSSRELVTLLFSRFYPKRKLDIKKLPIKEISKMYQLLNNQYTHYNLVPDFNESWDNYYIYQVNKEVLCGVKLEINSWVIHEMPGLDGWLFRKVLPYIPILNSIFQKGKIDFIGIERLYVKKGSENLLPAFLETLCAQFGVTKAMIGVDNKSPLHDLLKKNGKLGLLDKLITPSPGVLFSRTKGLTKQEEQTINDRPFYVSTYDLS